MKIHYLDTTLRDGAQMSGISLSLDDKLKIAKALDEFGVDFIEGGYPVSNETDTKFYELARPVIKRARLAAFGSTRHKDNKPQNDPCLKAIVGTRVRYAVIFGKSWDFHVSHALHTSLEENIRMIADSVAFLRGRGLQVIYDAEHFFDGYRARPAYALETVRAAVRSGAFNVTLCDTNGGCLPREIAETVGAVRAVFRREKLPAELGIHAHNDSECAVANSIAAVQEGVTLVHGTINGYGERCGNANLCSVIPDLQLKLGLKGFPDGKLKHLTRLSRYVSEIVNVLPDDQQPYVGRSAFAHKAGVHASAMAQHTATYEHLSPAAVGNERRILVSELAGKSNVLAKVKELKLDFAKDAGAASEIIQAVKKLEHQGYQFEDANASFALLVRRLAKTNRRFFDILGVRVIVENDPRTGRMGTEATIKLNVRGEEEYAAAEGDGPVNALDNALRKALERSYPVLKEMSLSDFKVRVINATESTAAKVRVTIESRDRDETWGTIGVSENVIEASWQALLDSFEYKLLKQAQKRNKKQ